MTLAIFTLAYAGLTALCLAMTQNYGHVFHEKPGATRRQVLRFAGALLLALAWILAITTWGGPIGCVAASVITSIGGLLLVFLLAYTPRLAIALVPVGVFAGLIEISLFY